MDQGLVKHIGVSNFSVKKLKDLLTYARIKPAVNQIKVHPYFRNDCNIDWCRSQACTSETLHVQKCQHYVCFLIVHRLGQVLLSSQGCACSCWLTSHIWQCGEVCVEALAGHPRDGVLAAGLARLGHHDESPGRHAIRHGAVAIMNACSCAVPSAANWCICAMSSLCTTAAITLDWCAA